MALFVGVWIEDGPQFEAEGLLATSNWERLTANISISLQRETHTQRERERERERLTRTHLDTVDPLHRQDFLGRAAGVYCRDVKARIGIEVAPG